MKTYLSVLVLSLATSMVGLADSSLRKFHGDYVMASHVDTYPYEGREACEADRGAWNPATLTCSKKFDQKVSFQAVGGHYSVNVTTGGGGRSCQFTSTEFRQISPNQVEFFAVGQDYFDLVPEDKVVCQVTLTFTNSNTVSVSSTLEECRSFCSLNRDAVLEIASAQRLSK